MHYFTFDYSAFCKVEIVFDDGSKLWAESVLQSDSVFMLPWIMKGRRVTYNADISRAIASLLPVGSVNKEMLAGDELASRLTYAVMTSIEREWNLLGSEERAGESLKTLRKAYEVVTAEITSYHLPGYGRYTYSGAHEEMNLHASVRRSNFPSNVTDALVLRYSDKKAEGVDEFLKSAAKYEDLALSVPWLNGYVRDNPRAAVRISYVHRQSFGDGAMRVFAADMKLLGREDLIEQVKSQQADIALLLIYDTNTESHWLLFPDKHMMLWRYVGSSRLLKWTPKDFQKGEGQCSDWWVVCSGREITAEGMLAPGTRHQISLHVQRPRGWKCRQSTLLADPCENLRIDGNPETGFTEAHQGTPIFPHATRDSVRSPHKGLNVLLGGVARLGCRFGKSFGLGRIE